MITTRYRAQSSTRELKTKEVHGKQNDPLFIDHENDSRVLRKERESSLPFSLYSCLFYKRAPPFHYASCRFYRNAELLLQTIHWKIMLCAMVLNEDRNYADRKIALVLFKRIKGTH